MNKNNIKLQYLENEDWKINEIIDFIKKFEPHFSIKDDIWWQFQSVQGTAD